MLSTTFYYKTRYNATVQELATFKAKIAILEAVKARENEILRDYAKNTVIKITEKHDNELKGIKNEITHEGDIWILNKYGNIELWLESQFLAIGYATHYKPIVKPNLPLY